MKLRRLGMCRAVPLALVLAGPGMASAFAVEEPVSIDVTIKDHRFSPAEIHVAKEKPAVLKIRNEDATAEEFDSSALKVEKVIAAGRSAIVRLRPLGAGRYPFEGEFHSDTAKGVVISE